VLLRSSAVIILAVCLSTPAFSQQASPSSRSPLPHHDLRMKPMRGMPSDQEIDRSLDTLRRKLNLTSTQVTGIRQLAQSRRESMRSIHEQAKPKFEQLMALLEQTNPDPSAVGRIVVDLKAIHDQARTKQVDLEKQLSEILNPAQQQTVNTLRSQAQTFSALRNIGLLRAPEFSRGQFMRDSNP
jgi:Spy/CpxP family protein refolding chaperone